MTRPIRACVFDAYGTLFDVHAAVRGLAGRIGPRAAEMSQLWRTKQLEYTWVRSLAGRHADFRQVTKDALDYSIQFFSINDKTLSSDLMALYEKLDAYPEALGVLRHLRALGIKLAILSNGTPDWLEVAVRTAGIGELLDAVWSVEDVGIFKPDPKVYRVATRGFGMAAADMGFVSSNAWDAAGAATNGFRALWVNRSGAPAEYASMVPVRQVANLATLAKEFGLE
ncbi:MAG: haloacid dehalogenase type II [Alphaproteobacteria bacterium]|nr:haloacid dehalogenase type II [Alphaproteobacteria bacterium]